ncbi:AAA family ATPase [Methanobacterium subterraneum]|uniref:AAA family ATPase n=3 Tax=Methanobacterium subterraneum TaxID=59277 RepID=A0A7K4DP78_9EURY|nr:ATP-dependent endonuclease [Methanobacterium subterraneum]NMO10220.1 AAA family ATPase [Methanobacterium subterraneum]
MIIECVKVKNFRSIHNETLYLNDITALIGPNGVGKSSFLKAIDLFYNPNANYSQKDFYNEDMGSSKKKKNIEITITFSVLDNDELERFKKYVKNGKLSVKKVLEWPKSKGSQKYYGNHLENPDFDDFRNSGGTNLGKEYKKLKENGYDVLPDYKNQENGRNALSEWEDNNPDKCELREDDGQFFGFKNVGKAKLERNTHFIYIPAVLNASEEASDDKKSVFKQIMDIVIRSTFSQKKEYKQLEENFQENYANFILKQDDSLKELEKKLSETLGIYVPNSEVKINWQHQDIVIPLPNADTDLVEDDYGTSVERCGHGLQRAYIMSMFQYLAKITLENNFNDENETPVDSNSIPTLIIGIEEPEIYQHPNMQRYLSKILKSLAEGSLEGVAEKIQIVYSTHSPLFVDFDNFESIRKLNKEEKYVKQPYITQINSTNFEKVVEFIKAANNDETLTAEGFAGRINAIMTPWMNEGFFADMIVLVEGVTDRAAIIGYANALKGEGDLEGKGISVIPCMSKNNIYQPYAIFSKLNIPVYCLWDSDFKKHSNPSTSDKQREQQKEIRKNHMLLKLCKYEPEDWPSHVEKNHACFHNELEDTLKQEIGETVFNQIISERQNFYQMSKRKDALKRPKIIEHLVVKSKESGNSSVTLENIIKSIYEMRTMVDDQDLETTQQTTQENSAEVVIKEIPSTNTSGSNELGGLDKWFET